MIVKEESAPNGFSVHYEGKPEEIDARTLLDSLGAINGLVNEVARLEPSTANVRLKVRTHRPGSFVADLLLSPEVVEAARNLFTVDQLRAGAIVLSTVIGLFRLRKLLKKEAPAEVKADNNGVLVQNSQGANTYVDNRALNIYMSNSQVGRLLDQNYATLAADSNIEEFVVTDYSDEPLFEAKREEFGSMVTGDQAKLEEERSHVDQNETLNIVKVSFERRFKWKFIYRGVPIGAEIVDSLFLAGVEAGTETFAKGDLLEVDLEIHQKYDDALLTYVNKLYRITKVHRHIRAKRQSALTFR